MPRKVDICITMVSECMNLDEFNRLFIDNRRSFVRFAYTYTRDEVVAEDVVMEAMICSQP